VSPQAQLRLTSREGPAPRTARPAGTRLLSPMEVHGGGPVDASVRQHTHVTRIEAPVRIEPYDPSWPVAFEAERAVLLEVLERWLTGPIEHIGSTAVVGLPAKPVVDIMAAVESLELSQPAISRLREVSYCYAPYRNDVMHWLCKPSPAFRTHHLHLVPFRSKLWSDRIAFRDRLRGDQGLANQYAALKHHLAQLYPDDRETYTEQKAPFIEEVLRAAKPSAA
jgi:GrpB-like predicted nucleotidyltransferase (UPF0157 family)